jgi:lysophospholipase L1-like esterase
MKKNLLHTLLFLVGLLGAAQAIAWSGIGFLSYAPGAFYTPDGTKIPIAEIANFLTGGGYLGGGADEHPRGRLTPGLRVKQGYDRPRWDYFDSQGCILIQHNSLGFREPEFPVQKPAGEFRVLALGDSFTYGSGVLAEDAWPQVVERGLAVGGRRVDVINCGFAAGSYTPDGYDAWVRTDGLLLDPDLVIVGFCLNDMGNGNDVPMLSYQGKTTVGCPVALIDQFLTYFANRQAMDAVPDYSEVVAAHPETWIKTQAALQNLQRILAERRIPLVVAVIPMISQINRDPNPYAGLHRGIGEFCAANGIPCVDLLAPFVGRSELDLWVHPTDQHPNHIGQKLLGDGIVRFLRERGLDGAR